MEPLELFPHDAASDQFRLATIQTFNWGTFAGVSEFMVAEKGHLFVGPSGSGKSTILDAHAALLTPPKWLDFNVAARETDRRGKDRNAVTYLRGAWAEQTGESGEVAAQYLRTGTTWSAVAETYRQDNGKCVVLAQVLWVRGASNHKDDVKKQFIVLERKFDVRELQAFAASNFDVRRLKRDLADAYVTNEFSVYQERFRRLLGIDSERALRLLHKTQSAKNLGDLNTFLRDFMLDDPETFEIADRLVSEFGELSAAHQSVVTASEQIETLSPAWASHKDVGDQKTALAELDELLATVETYRDTRRHALLEAHICELGVEAEAAKLEAGRLKEDADQQEALLHSLKDQRRGMGGGVIEQLESQIAATEEQKEPCLRRREGATEACKALGCELPGSPADFLRLCGAARDRLVRANDDHEQREAHKDTLKRHENELGRRLQDLRTEVEAMERQRSNIPAKMLVVRHAIAAAAGLPDEKLPFVGELVEVKREEQRWRGAIERVLHGFSLSLLVDDNHYPAVSSYVNRQHFGERVVYLRMLPGQVGRGTAGPNYVAAKLSVAADGYGEWVRGELRSRFDYVCAEDDQEFRSATKAITETGQVKHNSTRHEKDDRHRVDDARHWVLGFDNKDKLELFRREGHDVAAELLNVQTALTEAKTEDRRRQQQLLACQTLANTAWADIDLQALVTKIETLRRQMHAEKEARPDLRQLDERISAQERIHTSAHNVFVKAEAEVVRLGKAVSDSEARLNALARDLARSTVTAAQIASLDGRFARLNVAITLDTIGDAATRVTRVLGEDREMVTRQIGALTRHIEGCFSDFNRKWPAEAGGLDPTLASSEDYFAKLTRLENDGLPKFRQRFLDLLHEQSDQNLMLLSTKLEQERKAIRDRMDMVNESLEKAPFNPGTHLVIDTADRQIEDVRAFKRTLVQALSHSFTDDQAAAEQRFEALSQLVKRLSSQEAADKEWRVQALDVRQHVEFIAKELDDAGVELEVYRSGAGKSGGQRQKLAATCLAAALRYQLGGNDRALPSFSTVALDEAMDKSDAEFTTLAMNIFRTFGFQMIVATPLKSVMTLEPFIGGAYFVHIRDRKHSTAIPIEYDADTQRLQLTQEMSDAEAAAVS
ncbi:MAG TPA: SbcC/MukB-like Walker B domain-containing protein [Polyangia bacterium]|nr:SbcC/MukB-like Walker B domain-containing protein [Polyangia bacterium]